MNCQICGRIIEKAFKHHIVPKVRGGTHKGTIDCCKTCSKQVHMLYSEGELAGMTLEELLNTEDMKKYADWIREKRGDFKARKSKRLRKNKAK